MYLVVSHWEPLPGKEREVVETEPVVLSALRRTPGVVFAEVFKSDGNQVVIHGYESEEAYHRVQEDKNNEFARTYREQGVEENSRWLRSERGETLPHA